MLGSKWVVFAALAAAGALCGGAAAVEASGDPTADIVAAERAWAKAAVDADATAMASYMTDDYIEFALNPADSSHPASWTTQDKKSWVDGVRSGKDKYESVELRDLKVYVHGTMASVTGSYTQKGTSNGKDNSGSGVYVNTWVRVGGKWKVVSSVFP